MDYLGSKPRFNSLSLADLLRAREQFHPHLMHKANVVGTAIGRYLIRKDDPYPKRGNDETAPRSRKNKPPRRLDNSEVRSYSWPCVLVFVAEWRVESDFGTGDLGTSDFVPNTIYLEDGRSVPICVVEAPPIERAPAPIDLQTLTFPRLQISGGYPVIARRQHGMQIGSIGCLVTDGHTLYALTSRHVAGDTGEVLTTVLGGKEVPIGKTSSKQLTRKPFERMYDGWPGKNIAINLDIGLIELADARQWSPAIYDIGKLGPLAELSIYNLTLDLIGCPVAAHGCASGRLEGRIAALFYRYQSVGGLEYVADFLIGSREDAVPLTTHPGDSGTVWVLEDSPDTKDRRPIAVQWGGTVFSRDGSRMPFALATNLSTVCRELQIDMVRSREVASFDYWGAVGHYTIGSFACEQPKDKTLGDFFRANRSLISFDPDALTKDVEDLTDESYVQLADVPDVVWKDKESAEKPYGRKGPENPNHYVDLDFPDDDGKTLDALIKGPSSLKTSLFVSYYKSIGWNGMSQRGLLPFRVWQIYKQMVAFVKVADLVGYVAAAGILAHYVGDACQSLHGSYLTDGDPYRKPDGTKVSDPLPYKKNYATGVHSAYERNMVNVGLDDILADLPKKLKTNHGMSLVTGGRDAGYATIELMRRTRKTIQPLKIVEFYAPYSPSVRTEVAEKLWKKFKSPTLEVLADGCRTLAMLWESAWVEGKGDKIPKASLKKQTQKNIRRRYEKQDFLPSKPLGQIDPFL